MCLTVDNSAACRLASPTAKEVNFAVETFRPLLTVVVILLVAAAIVRFLGAEAPTNAVEGVIQKWGTVRFTLSGTVAAFLVVAALGLAATHILR